MAVAWIAYGDSVMNPEISWHTDRREAKRGVLATQWEGERSPMDLTDEQLVARAQGGDQWAFEELVNRHQNKAYAMALHMCSGEVQEAQDLTQEAFLRAFRNLGNFRGDSTFYTWFFRIVVNTCLDGRRRKRRWDRVFSFWKTRESDDDGRDELEAIPDPSIDNDPSEVLGGKQLLREVQKAMASLPERQRLALQLKVLHGMSLKDIAQVMGAAEGTVKSHLFRATHHLQDALKNWT
jgi:RNA polymerase sigma-70 factor, ECF subfamily